MMTADELRRILLLAKPTDHVVARYRGHAYDIEQVAMMPTGSAAPQPPSLDWLMGIGGVTLVIRRRRAPRRSRARD